MFTPVAFYQNESGYTPTDADAIAFLNATGITDPNISRAIDDFVIGMKANSLWSKTIAIYPFVGGTSTTHMYNLRDPRNLDAAYRISWSGGITHSATGVQGNGSNGYGNTHINDENNLTRNDKHIAVYSRTNVGGSYHDAGVYTSSPGVIHGMLLRDASNGNYYRANDGNNGWTITDSRGFFVGLRDSSTGKRLYRNGTAQSPDPFSSVTIATALSYKHYIMALNHGNSSNTAIQFSPREYCYFSFGSKFTAGEVSTYNTLVQSLQTSLGRNV